MGKNNKKATVETVTEVTKITVKDLCTEFQMDGKKIRTVIRSLGFRAPYTGVEGMGPRFKYDFDSNDPKLVKIRKALTDYKANAEEAVAN